MLHTETILMARALMEVYTKSYYPAGVLTTGNTACSASFIDLFHTALPVDSVVGYNMGSGEDAISDDAWGIPDRLDSMTLTNAGLGVSLTDLFTAENPEDSQDPQDSQDDVLPDDILSNLNFDNYFDLADDLFAITPYDDSSAVPDSLSAYDWLQGNRFANDLEDDLLDSEDDSEDDPLDPDDYV